MKRPSPHCFAGLLATFSVLLAPAALQAAATLVPLGSAAGFGVLAGTEITVAGPTLVRGDAGTTSGTPITGMAGLTLTGTDFGGGATTLAAQADLTAAYLNATTQPADFTYAAVSDLGGLILTPGVHRGISSLSITGNLTLDAGGNADAVWIFYAFSSLTTASGANILLTNGAQASNILWLAGSSATLGTGSHLEGNVMALSSITLTTGASVTGGVYARNAAVTLDTNTVGVPEPLSAFLAVAGFLGCVLRRQR